MKNDRRIICNYSLLIIQKIAYKRNELYTAALVQVLHIGDRSIKSVRVNQIGRYAGDQNTS